MRIRRHNQPEEAIVGRPGTAGRAISVSPSTGAHRFTFDLATQTGSLHVSAEVAAPGLGAVEFTSTPDVLEQQVSDAPQTADDWVRQNADKLRRFAGRWIAVSPKGIIAASEDFDDVFHKSREKGVRNPLVFKVPQPTAGPKVVSSKAK